MPRNRELMRVFRDMELVEQIGSGMSRILDAYDRSVFELSPSFTVVTFPFEEAFITQYDKKNGKINDKKNGKSKSLLNILKYNPTATIPDLVEVSGKSQSTISRELKEYQEAGLLRREGSRRSGRWVVE
jgi:predicted HTH transcriptional regulator